MILNILIFILALFFEGITLAEVPQGPLSNPSPVEELDELDVGALFSLSGYGVLGGHTELNGVLLAQQEINAKGGVAGRRLSIIAEDFRSEAKTAISALIKLHSLDKVRFIIGPNWSEFADVVAPVAQSNNILMISPSGYTPDLLKDRPLVFSLQYPPEKILLPFAEYIRSRKFDTILLFSSPNTYYELLSRTIKELLEGDLQIKQQTLSIDNLDYRSSILEIKRNGPNTGIIVFMNENGPASSLVKQARLLGVPAENLLLGPIVPYDEILRDNQKLNEGLIYFDYVSDLSAEFEKKYKERFREAPSLDSAKAYDALMLLSVALEKCLKTATSNTFSCVTINISQGMEDAASGPIQFGEKRERRITRPASKVFQMKSNKAVEISNYNY